MDIGAVVKVILWLLIHVLLVIGGWVVNGRRRNEERILMKI